MKMKFLWLTGMALVAISAFAATQFVKATDNIQAGGALVASWKEVGLTPGANVTYTLSALTNFTYGCVSGSKKSPTSPSAPVVTGGLSTKSGTWTARGGGSISAILAITPPNPDIILPSCPAGTKPVLAYVSYSGVSLSDGLGGSAPLPDAWAIYYNLT